jgi:DNA-directed RNA polymerase subunit RPC12/RpoP
MCGGQLQSNKPTIGGDTVFSCKSCGTVFPEPVEVVRDRAEGSVRGCPYCGSDRIVDLELNAEQYDDR